MKKVKLWDILIPVFFFIGAILAWEFIAKWYASPFIFPAPTEIIYAFGEGLDRVSYHFILTLEGVVLGFIIGVVIGTSLGIGIVYSGILKRIIFPVAIALRVTPLVAIAPIIVIWFGFGLSSKIVIAMIITLFPIIINTSEGLQMVEPESIELMQSIEATKAQIFRKLRLPSAMPSYFAGLKIAIGGAVIGAVLAEVVAPSSGLGYLVVLATSYLDTPFLFANVLVLFGMGIALFEIVVLLERIIVPWKGK